MASPEEQAREKKGSSPPLALGADLKGCSGVCVLRMQPLHFRWKQCFTNDEVGPSKSAYRRRLQTTASGED